MSILFFSSYSSFFLAPSLTPPPPSFPQISKFFLIKRRFIILGRTTFDVNGRPRPSVYNLFLTTSYFSIFQPMRIYQRKCGTILYCTYIEADIHLIDHFCQKHTDLSSLKWVVLHKVGKETNNPASHLLKWEHAYIEHFGCVYPHGLNTNE
jgi:hypothetical protein